MRRALFGCAVLSLGAAPVGVFLMLRRMSLTGDAMAHAILPGAALAYLLYGLSAVAMTLGGLAAGLLVALLAGATARQTNNSEDSTLAAFYLGSLALGVLLISAKGSNVDLLHVLFGTALALDNTAFTLLLVTSLASLCLLSIVYRALVLECLDSEYLSSFGGMGKLAHFVFLVLVVANLVAGFHALGTLMAVGLMILPACIARFWFKHLGSLLVAATIIAASACWLGLLLSFYFGLATSPSIVLALAVGYVLSVLLGPLRGILRRPSAASLSNSNNREVI